MGSSLAIRSSKVSAEPQTARRRLFASVMGRRVAAQVRPAILGVSYHLIRCDVRYRSVERTTDFVSSTIYVRIYSRWNRDAAKPEASLIFLPSQRKRLSQRHALCNDKRIRRLSARFSKLSARKMS